MVYVVKELFLTLQGEGAHTGRAAVFCRFTGCNLWSGRADDRPDADCRFCDTDFIGTDGPGGGRFFDAASLAGAIAQTWSGVGGRCFVVFTGGEPLLQLDRPLIDACHQAGFEIAVETNGTLPAPDGIDWLTVSPKRDAPWILRHGNELKLVYPQQGVGPGLDPASLEGLPFAHFWLQPLDGPERAANITAAVAYCLDHPRWRLSLQTHKLIGIP